MSGRAQDSTNHLTNHNDILAQTASDLQSNEKEKTKEPAGSAIELFKQIAKILARGVAKNQYLSAIVLICVIAGVVAVALIFGDKNLNRVFYALLAFLLFGMIAVLVISTIQIREDKRRVSNGPNLVIGKADTYHLAEKMTAQQRDDILEVLNKAVDEVSQTLNISNDLLRANLFGVDDQGMLRMLDGLTVNMNGRPEEKTIVIPIGFGSTGRCFKSGDPNVAVFHSDWGENVLPSDELKKVHPDLKWIISIPVRGKGANAGPIWVMNIDCIGETREETSLRAAVDHLLNWSYMLALITSETQSQIVVDSTTETEATNTTVASIYPVTNFTPGEIKPVNSSFINATRELKTVPPLNDFTKDDFTKGVQETFILEEKKP